LIEHIWEGAAVTDNTLEQCLAEIRRVLGDDSRHPRFIKTVPRAGYRFIGAVEEVRLEVSVSGTLAEAAAGVAGSQERAGNHKQTAAETTLARRTAPISPLLRSRAALVSLLTILIVGVAVSIYVIQRRRSPARSLAGVTLPSSAGKRSLAVMYFDNESGDSDLNWLREGLADMMITGLSRSEKLTVLSRQQLHALLDRLGHNESEKIRLDEALDLAQKSQAQIFVLGSFARLGSQMRIDAQLHDARDGQLLAAERLVVDQPAQILTQVDLLSLKLATYLAATPADQQASLASVMTHNLEAYRYYSLGLEKAQALQNPEAIAFFERAVALDPEFAMAHARIGYIYSVTWNFRDKGKSYLEKAFQLSGRLTEKDKLHIAAWYAIANFDYSGAIKSFREIVSRFPLEVEAYRRLGVLLQGEERFDEAIEVFKQGLVIDSGAKELYNGLGGVYSDLGRHDEAIDCFQRYVQLVPQEANAHDSLALGYQGAGRYDEAIAEYQKASSLKPDFEIAIVHIGNAYFQQGRYQRAIKEYERYIQNAPSDFERSRGYNSIAYVELRKGNLGAAQLAAKSGQKYNPKSFDLLLLIAIEKRDLTTAARLKEEIDKLPYPERGIRGSQRPNFYFRGYLNLKSGRTAEAIDDFKAALKHRSQLWNFDTYEDCLANGFLDVGRYDEAIAEYERILKLNPNYPLVHYHLAQAYERKGQRDRARAAYQRFLEVWKDADADVPEVAAAKKQLSSQL
jgi:tetratricopeptide (TPR) repeat protein